MDDIELMKVRLEKVSNRKKLLFGCACCRAVWDELTDRGREQLVIAEEFAEGDMTGEIDILPNNRGRDYGSPGTCQYAPVWLDEYGSEKYVRRLFHDRRWPDGFDAWKVLDGIIPVETVSLCGIRIEVRRPFPCPACEMILKWNSGCVVGIARAIYEKRDWSVMPVLADALEDAGCISDKVIEHLRGGGPFFHGDWVVDLILGRE